MLTLVLDICQQNKVGEQAAPQRAPEAYLVGAQSARINMSPETLATYVRAAAAHTGAMSPATASAFKALQSSVTQGAGPRGAPDAPPEETFASDIEEVRLGTCIPVLGDCLITASVVHMSVFEDGHCQGFVAVAQEANSFFQKIYASEITVDELVKKLKSFKASSNAREKQVHSCMPKAFIAPTCVRDP